MTRRRDGLVRLIGVFKLVKASALIALGAAGLLGMSQRAGETAEEWTAGVGLFPGHAHLHGALEHLRTVDRHTAAKFGAAAIAYAAVFAVEGVGLLLGKRWAEWMTVGVTTSFVPIEVYELCHRFSAGKVAVLALNIAIVIYLVARRLADRRRLASRVLGGVTS